MENVCRTQYMQYVDIAKNVVGEKSLLFALKHTHVYIGVYDYISQHE